MQPLQARLVTACQQVLALGVVLAVLTPASGVVSLDVVGEAPGSAPGRTASTVGLMSATVPTRAVTPRVTEVPLTTESGDTEALRGRTVVGRSATDTRVQSQAQAVPGYGAVGVTWEPGQEFSEESIALRVRTREGETWGAWQDIEYHDDHAPDAGSAEALNARPGTDPVFVGEVDDVQVEVQTDGATLPDDLSLAVITPGESAATETVAPAEGGAGYAEEADATDQEDEGLQLQAARAVSQPAIFSRAEWGADESIRDKSSLRYGSISAGFVHHTVNANSYTEAQVPGIIRSIYAYHVRSRGWSDIGYNFLVDRFGRIWEGRFGGIDKPVVGAHTLGYNEYAFAMSAIGNFEEVQPSDTMLRAYGQLFGWKLTLHGVDPSSMSQKVGRSTFAAVSGHRDAGSTACPGRYLYAQIPLVRTYAKQAGPVTPPPPPPPPPPTPVVVTEPSPQTNLAGSPHPDLIVRRAADGRGFVLPTGGLSSFSTRTVVGRKGWDKRADVLVTSDLTGDARPDLVVVDKSGALKVRAGRAGGRFGATVKKVRWTRGFQLFAALGDVNGNGRGDLVARWRGRLVLLAGTRKGGLRRTVMGKGFGGYRQLVGTGDVNGDGHADLLARAKRGVYLYPGTGTGTFGRRQVVAGSWGGYDRLVGGGDYTGDSQADLLARSKGGRIHVLPGRGDGSFGAARGPANNVKSTRFLSSAGSIVGGPGSDLVGVSGTSLVVLGNRDTYDLGAPIDTGVSFSAMDLVLNAGDVDRDGSGDVVTRNSRGKLWLFRGNGQGQLSGGTSVATGFSGVAGLKAVGDVTGDGLPDLIGTPQGGGLTIWRGTGSGFAEGVPVQGRVPVRGGLPSDLSPYDWVLETGDMQLRGAGDFFVRERATGRLLVFNGRRSGVSTPRVLGDGMEGFDLAG